MDVLYRLDDERAGGESQCNLSRGLIGWVLARRQLPQQCATGCSAALECWSVFTQLNAPESTPTNTTAPCQSVVVCATLPHTFTVSPPAIVSSIHPISYVTCAVQAVSAFTNWGWWIYAAVPAYGGYMLWTSIIYPYFIKSKPNTEDTIDEKTRAKMERADRRAERRRMKRF